VSAGGAQCIGGKHQVRCEPHKSITRRDGPVAIHDDGDAAAARGGADRHHHVGQPIVHQQHVDVGHDGIRIGDRRAEQTLVAARRDHAMTDGVDQNAGHRGGGVRHVHDGARRDAFVCHPRQDLRRDSIVDGAEHGSQLRAAAETRNRNGRVGGAAAQHRLKRGRQHFLVGGRHALDPEHLVEHRHAGAQDGRCRGRRAHPASTQARMM
jgi:hypothetical protein